MDEDEGAEFLKLSGSVLSERGVWDGCWDLSSMAMATIVAFIDLIYDEL